MQHPEQITHTSQHTIHPNPLQAGLFPASITDTALSELTPTGAAWLFPSPKSGGYDPSLLAKALEATLAIYPQLCGSLTLSFGEGVSEYPAHTHRYGRVWVRWGTDEPGLLLTQAKFNGPLTDVLPPHNALVMPDIYALLRLRPSALGPACPGPASIAQITSFSCGGIAIALMAQHALLDAHALAYVIRDWGTIHSSMINHISPPMIKRTYAPMDLDAHARDAECTVPQLRLDFWAYDPSNPADQAPGWFTRSRVPPPEVDAMDLAAGRPRGPRAPFETWDADAVVGDAILDLSSDHVKALTVPGVSALDSVLGTVWRAIVRARDIEAKVWMHGCVGLRTRLGLSDDFQGAPLINVSAGLDSTQLLRESGRGARVIRESIDSVTKESAAAVLHHMAQALDPAREWNVFVGSQHILSTSWLGIGAYSADFGFGTPVDGIVVVMEAKDAIGEHGARGGVSLRLLLREDVLARVLADPELVREK